jgi:hypothetical protein
MAGRAIRNTSRVVFCVCGLTSLFTGFFYAQLRGVELPVESEWIPFVAVFAVVGLVSVAVGVLPSKWTARLCKMDWQDPRLFGTPLKVLSGFAAIAYLVAVVADYAPHRWNLDPQIMLVLCPMYFVKMTFDPAPREIFLMLAPMNAAVFGSVGLTLSYAWLTFRKRA